MMDIPNAWGREVINGNIIWTAKMDIKCYHCGKTAHVNCVVNEGKYDEKKYMEVKGANGKTEKIYPIECPPPNSEMELIFPNDENWTMLCHLTRNFFPFETCNAIRMGCEPFTAFLHWYKAVGSQFGEWICSSDECFVEAAISLKKEYNDVLKMSNKGVDARPN